MRFLINPECYHKMCESCVDRIFSSGPANCPVAGCHRTLRKAKFRTQTFEDIQVEREVDIRREVMAMYVSLNTGGWNSSNGKLVSTAARTNSILNEHGTTFWNSVRRLSQTWSTAPMWRILGRL